MRNPKIIITLMCAFIIGMESCKATATEAIDDIIATLPVESTIRVVDTTLKSCKLLRSFRAFLHPSPAKIYLTCGTPTLLYKEDFGYWQVTESLIELRYRGFTFCVNQSIGHEVSELIDFTTWFDSLLAKARQRQVQPKDGDFWRDSPLTPDQGWKLVIHILERISDTDKTALSSSWQRIMDSKIATA